MKLVSLLLISLLTASLQISVLANDIIYATGFEPPGFAQGESINGIDGWQWFRFQPRAEVVVTTENPSAGTQCLRLKGVFNSVVRSVITETAGNAPLKVELRVDVRLDGPQTGTLGTPAQDILSANFGATVLLPNGNTLLVGGFFVSSAGKIWTYNGTREEDYKYSVSAPLGAYHALMLRLDFFERTVTYLVDGVELGSTSFHPFANETDQIAAGFLQLAGPSNPIHTPDLDYDPANYTAYFDNFSIESIPLLPTDTDVRFAGTDFAVSETGGFATVKVVRRGYTNSAVEVAFNTADGSGVAKADYLPVSAALAFAPGEREREIRIPVFDDTFSEADKTVNLSLTALSAGIRSARPAAVLWLLDNERPGSAETAYHFDYSGLGLRVVYDTPSVLALPSGKFLVQFVGENVSGEFTGVVARFNGDGSWDASFEPYPVFPVGGPPQLFLVNNGAQFLVNRGDRLARLQSNGREDATFQVSVAGGYGVIVDVAVQPDQKIVIAGAFDTVNGIPRKNVARLRITGTVDPSFDAGESTDDLVWDVAWQPDGKLVLGGWFHSVAGQPRSLLARLNADGSLDTGFDPGASLGDSFNGFPEVTSLAIQGDGRILVGGFFDSYQGLLQNSLVRLLPDAAVDPEFQIGTGIASSGHTLFPDAIYPGRVAGMLLQPDGKLIVAGQFVRVDGAFAFGVVRLTTAGTLDSSFRLGGADSFIVPPLGFIPPVVAGAALALLPDGDLLTTLTHYRLGTRTEPVTYSGVVRLNGDRPGKKSEK
jgi:uncharacterized delta-60 repeat protein